MPEYLGIDTSNYTTSVAVYNSDDCSMISYQMLLPVKNGELGLRQSDAVFYHTKQLPILMEKFKVSNFDIRAIGVSNRPRNVEDSYMPCFLAGEGLSRSICALNNIKEYKTSHQVGHILAALYSADKIEYIFKPFIAFHVSGGTTECLLVSPHKDEIIKAELIATSLDLKAGQAIDRIGVMLGLKFPCGKELEKLALKSDKEYNPKVFFKDYNCSLSGLENQCKKMHNENIKHCDIAKYCLDFIYIAISEMTSRVLKDYDNCNIIYAGGVMSNKIIKDKIMMKYPNVCFAKPQYSCDNAAGIAVYAYLKESMCYYE